MDAVTVTVIALVGLFAGFLAGWFAAVARTAAAGERQRATLLARVGAAEAESAALDRQLEEQRTLTRELGAQARLDSANRDERDRREQQVLRALAPVQESLQQMQAKVDGLERERREQFGSLAEQLRQAQRSDEALRSTTESLAGALRSNSTRGVWGETQLQRIVETAGMVRHVDFDTQASITTAGGAGRPDMVVHLPGGKSLAVDAKVPLDAYLQGCAIPATTTGEEAGRRRALLAGHVKAVRAHVDALAAKGYWTGLAASPEFVICFLPHEGLLAVALDHDPTLLDYAFGRRVVLATPVNLWAVLKTVAFTWTQQDVSTEARKLFDLGTELYQRLGSLAGHADDLRKGLERTVLSYNRFAASLETRVLVTARKLPGIDPTRLDALGSPAQIETTPRALTAPEFTDHEFTDHDDTTSSTRADVGDLRDRLATRREDEPARGSAEGVSRPGKDSSSR